MKLMVLPEADAEAEAKGAKPGGAEEGAFGLGLST